MHAKMVCCNWALTGRSWLKTICGYQHQRRIAFIGYSVSYLAWIFVLSLATAQKLLSVKMKTADFCHTPRHSTFSLVWWNWGLISLSLPLSDLSPFFFLSLSLARFLSLFLIFLPSSLSSLSLSISHSLSLSLALSVFLRNINTCSGNRPKPFPKLEKGRRTFHSNDGWRMRVIKDRSFFIGRHSKKIGWREKSFWDINRLRKWLRRRERRRRWRLISRKREREKEREQRKCVWKTEKEIEREREKVRERESVWKEIINFLFPLEKLLLLFRLIKSDFIVDIKNLSNIS